MEQRIFGACVESAESVKFLRLNEKPVFTGISKNLDRPDMSLQTDHLDEGELETILAIAANGQTGRITEYEIKELVRVYREYHQSTSAQTKAT